MRLLPRDHRVAVDPNSALSSEGPIRGVHQTMPELRMDEIVIRRRHRINGLGPSSGPWLSLSIVTVSVRAGHGHGPGKGTKI
jgi:hypothetical protein